MKPAHYPAETDWHQDAGYWQDRSGSGRAVTCWLALTPAWRENGGMQFIPGSHRGPIQEHYSIAERSEINGALATAADERKAVAVSLEPGDATFHHCRTLHYAGGNATATPRYGGDHALLVASPVTGDRPDRSGDRPLQQALC